MAGVLGTLNSTTLQKDLALGTTTDLSLFATNTTKGNQDFTAWALRTFSVCTVPQARANTGF